MSSTAGDETTSEGASLLSFDDTMDKLFDQQSESTEALATVWDPNWYNIADQAINVINLFHDTSGLSYGESIIAVTCMIRVLLLPIFIRSQQNTSRMAHMQPEMNALKTKMEALGKNPDRESQARVALEMRALFTKYQCNPFGAMVIPFLQMPFFMGMFFGIRKMPEFFPDQLATGGLLWFPDLTVPDPYYILPLGSALTLLVSVELGKHETIGSSPEHGQIMVNFMRFLSVSMVPVVAGFSSGLNCYWMTNNLITMGQSVAFRNKAIRKFLNIWDRPKPVPGMPQAKGIVESIQGIVSRQETEAEKIAAHNRSIENKKMMSGRARAPNHQRRRR